jgi:plastocyanin
VTLAAPALAKAPTIKKATVTDFSFSPRHLSIKRGTKVVWHWATGFHTVTWKSGPKGTRFSSPGKASGSYGHVFTKAGVYHLYCKIHPFMTETIVAH